MAEPPESFLGMVLADRYELSSVLGQGQGGIVFKARHRQLDKFVALKLLLPDNMADKTAFMRFEREAHSIGRLNHPNIVAVFDLGRWRNERPFLVMDYIEGQDLQELVGKDGRIPLARAIRITTQICSALSHAHKRGVIHRDLKPRNIMIIDAEDIMDFVKVVDFGIAKPFDVDQSEALTLEGYVVGTPLYMSPEQCSSSKVDARTDIYSIGVLLYKMLTGVNPINGKNLTEIMSNQINTAPLPFEEASQYVQVPKSIQQTIYKSLAKDPNQRQSSMSELRRELNEAFELEQTRLYQPSSISAEPEGVISVDPVQSSEASFDYGSFGDSAKPMHTINGASFASPEPSASSAASSKAVDSLREKAESGDLSAQYDLVLRLEYGQGCKPNPAEAARWLKQAAQRGLSQAQWRLGDHLLRGEGGFGVSPTEAIAWLSKSAEQGYDAAQFTLAWCYENGVGCSQDLRKAISYYQLAAKQGNSQAIEQLRHHLASTPKITESFATFGSSPPQEDADDPESLYLLACRLRDSGQRAGDKDRAVQLFERAAQLGHDLAHISYIEMCLRHPHRKDLQSEAFSWLEQAAQQNNHRAGLLLAACLRNGIACAKNPSKSMELIANLANNENNPTAQAILGACMLTGEQTARNIPRGIALLKQASESGDGYARWKLAICYRTGVGVTKDPKMLEQLLNQSAEDFFPQAIEDFWKPNSLTFQEAYQIFKTLASTGNRNASLWLGICAENGLGTARDLNAALNYYKEAQSKGLQTGQKGIDRVKELLQTSKTS